MQNTSPREGFAGCLIVRAQPGGTGGIGYSRDRQPHAPTTQREVAFDSALLDVLRPSLGARDIAPRDCERLRQNLNRLSPALAA